MIYNLILEKFTEYLSKQTSFITGKWTLPHHSLTTGSNKVAAILVWTCFHFFFRRRVGQVFSEHTYTGMVFSLIYSLTIEATEQ